MMRHTHTSDESDVSPFLDGILKYFFPSTTVKASFTLQPLFFLQHEFRKQCESSTTLDHVGSEQVEELDLVHKICCENNSAFCEVAIIRNFFESHIIVKTQHYGN